MNIYELRKLAGREEINYDFLISALKNYRSPRNKIQALLKSKELIRVKKGLYIFGEKPRQEPYSKELLANLIYGPSAISLEYALSYYGLIPERVEVITSITNNRHKYFHSPIGDFEYVVLSQKRYSIGIIQISLTPTKHFLMAIKEKALADLLTLRTEIFSIESQLHTHLLENLRIDEMELQNIDCKKIATLATIYKNQNVYLLTKILEKNYG